MAKKPNHKKIDARKSVDLKSHLKKVDVGVKDGVFVFTSPLTVEEFSQKIGKSTAAIIKYFFMNGRMMNVNSVLDEELIGELCLEFGYDFRVEKEINVENVLENLNFDASGGEKRPPIVTIMGHVDHGKTTLLDVIRKSAVTKTEAGGITQHIGAYQVNHNGQLITFIDTPGHEAFTEMRARGANVTDIVVLVVAADDGIKVQTQEALDHARAAGVDIIIFINKMDKPGANEEKVMSQFSEMDIIPEEWGGKYIFVRGSALKNEGVEELLQAITLVAEMKELRANKDALAYGTIIEANLDKGYGPVATLLIQNGTLKKGDYFIAGSMSGKVRVMFDDRGNEISEAGPSKPVKIAGLDEVPAAGDKFLALRDEREAKEIAQKIRLKKMNLGWSEAKEDPDKKNLNILLKTDVHGSLEAIKQMAEKIHVEGTSLNIIRSAVGQITESDVRLAQASHAKIVGFNLKPSRVIKELADQSGVDVQTYNVIYNLKESLEQQLKGSLDPISVEEALGEAKVLQTWHHSEVGTIAGCVVLEGKIKRGARARVVRDGVVIYDTEIASLQHGKNQVTEMTAGNECGLTLKKFNDLKKDDIIDAYVILQKTIDEISGDTNGKPN